MKWFEKIRERRMELDLSQAELAQKVRMSQAAIDKIERGLVQRPRHLPDLVAALGIDPKDIEAGGAEWFANMPGGVQGPPPIRSVPDDALPVFSADARIAAYPPPIESSIQFTPKPSFPPLPGEAYGLMVVNDDMFPAYEAGEIALVNPRLPVIRGTDAVLYVKGDQEHLGIILGRVGRHDVGRGDDIYSLEQWNLNGEKPGTIVRQIPRKDVVAAHRVVGKLFR